MSWTVRQISQRADGGDIVRTRAIAADELVVGRGTDCDIQIADLGIMLRHAKLRRLTGDRVAAEATGGIPLEIGGRFVNRAEFGTVGGASIGMASHRLTLDPGEGEAITVTVERMAPPVDAAQARSETGVFALKSVMPGKRAMAWLLLLGVLGVFLAWPLWSDVLAPKPRVVAAAPAVHKTAFSPDSLWTSGPLSKAHASLSNNCAACHVKGFQSVTDTACAACHKATPDHAPLDRLSRARAEPAGLAAETTAKLHHQFNLPEGRCASCHREHEGANAVLTVAESYCTDCHAGLKSRLRDTGLLDAPSWSGHPQFRPTLVVQPSLTAPQFARVSLDTRPSETSGLKFPHRLHLSASNLVARMVQEGGDGRAALKCADCHRPDADGVRFRRVEMERDCGQCHDLAFSREGGVTRTLPHGKPDQVRGILMDFAATHPASAMATMRRSPGIGAARPPGGSIGGPAMIRAVFGRGGACFDCHGIVAPSRPGALNFGIAPVTLADHYLPKARFPHRRHKATACATCHKVAESDSSADVILPGVATCRECHGSPKVKVAVPSTCETCHGFHFGDKKFLPTSGEGDRASSGVVEGRPPHSERFKSRSTRPSTAQEGGPPPQKWGGTR